MADDRHARRRRRFVLERERAAHQRPYAQRLEESVRDAHRRRRERLVARAADRQARSGRAGDRLERPLRPPPVEKRRHRRDLPMGRDRRAVLEDDHQPVLFLERQAAQHDRVDDGEDRGRDADAQREHREGDEREGGRLPERADGEAHIGPDGAE
jgi:hypothetical protein